MLLGDSLRCCIQGNIHPCFIFTPFTLVVSRCIKTRLNVSSYCSLNKLFLGEFKTGKIVCKGRSAEITGAKLTLYTVRTKPVVLCCENC